MQNPTRVGLLVGIIVCATSLMGELLTDMLGTGNENYGWAACVVAMFIGTLVGVVVSNPLTPDMPKKRYLIRVLAADGVSIRKEWFMDVDSEEDLHKQLALDSRLDVVNDDYQVTPHEGKPQGNHN